MVNYCFAFVGSAPLSDKEHHWGLMSTLYFIRAREAKYWNCRGFSPSYMDHVLVEHTRRNVIAIFT